MTMPAAGQRLADRYELLSLIATGGMAQVWRANDSVLGRDVAVKILHSHLATDVGFLLRFQREAVAAARLSHPSIVAIYDTVSDLGMEAIVMELVHGRTLRAVLDDIKVLSEHDAIDLGSQIAEALAAAHRVGVVHRDIKPSNILLCTDRRVMVTDFGIAKAGEDTDLTVTGTLLGTAKYLAPEQVSGDEVDARADLYALGIVLYESVTGQPPFKADTDAATALARLHQPPPQPQLLRPDLSPSLNAVIHRLMARSPSGRFGTALDVRAALSAVRPGAAQQDQTLVVSDLQHDHDETFDDHTSGAIITSGSDYDDEPHELDDEEPQGFLRSERSWMLPALALLLTAAALVVAVQLFRRSPLGSTVGDDTAVADGGLFGDEDGTAPDEPTTQTTFATITELVEPRVAGAVALDEPALGGDGDEFNDLVPNAFDGDDDTVWRTDTYRGPLFGRLKPGVGFLIDLGGRAEVSEIELDTESEGWSIEFYVGDDFPPDPSSWGAPAATIVDGDGRERVELQGVGTQLLLWITDHGLSDDGNDEGDEDDFRFELAEIVVR